MNINLFIEFGGLIITLFSFLVIFIVERTAERRSHFLYLFYASVFSIQLITFIEKWNIIIPGRGGLILSSIEFMILCSGIFLILPSLYLFIFSKIQVVSRRIILGYIISPLVLMIVMTILVLVGSAYELFEAEVIIALICILFVLSSVFFVIKLFQIIREYKKVLLDHYSFTEGMEMRWIIKLSYAFMVLAGLIVLNELFLFYALQAFAIQLFVAYLSLLVLDYIFKSNKSQDFLSLTKEDAVQHNISEEDKGLYERIDDVIVSKSLYLNPSLNIADVAKEVGVNYKYISKEINAQGITFLELINAKRIAKAKLMLEDKSNEFLSVEEIGKQVGFKSKATFYKYFKEKHKQTPSMFRKSL